MPKARFQNLRIKKPQHFDAFPIKGAKYSQKDLDFSDITLNGFGGDVIKKNFNTWIFRLKKELA